MEQLRAEMEKAVENGIKVYVRNDMQKWNKTLEQEGRVNEIIDEDFIEAAEEQASAMIMDFSELQGKLNEWSTKMYGDGALDYNRFNEYIDWEYIVAILQDIV